MAKQVLWRRNISRVNWGGKREDRWLTMANSSLTGGTQTNISFHELFLYQPLTSFSTVRILLSLHKESSLHSPSKLLYLCLATTDLLVGLVAQPLAATWRILIGVFGDTQMTQPTSSAYRFAFWVGSLMTMATISVERLLALLLGLRYKEITTLRHTYHCSHLLVFDSDCFFIPFLIKV